MTRACRIIVVTLALTMPIPAQAVSGSTHADKQEILAVYGDAFIEEVNGLPVLHVKGNPYEMGRQYGILAGDRVEHAVDMLDVIAERNRDAKGIPLWFAKSLRRLAGFVFWLTFPDEVRQEIDGMVDGARERGHRLSRIDLAFINSVIDVVGVLKPVFAKRPAPS